MSVSTTWSAPASAGPNASISAAVRDEAVRLKRDDDAAVQRARRGQHRRDLGRMMAVVVDDENAARLAADLEPALGAAELAQAGGDPLERHAELQPDRDGGERVQQVVPPRHVQRRAGPSVDQRLSPDRPSARARRFTVAVTRHRPQHDVAGA